MKYCSFIVLMILVHSCSINNKLEAQEQSKESLVSHEFITGQWVDSYDLERVKARELSEPHPFRNVVTNHFTCIKEGKPYYDDWGNNAVYLEKKDDYYEYTSEHVRLKLQFNVSVSDTSMTLEYRFQSNEPQTTNLRIVPMAKSCDVEYLPGVGIRSGIAEAYNHYYFHGKYSVKELGNENMCTVEISVDQEISGLTDYDNYHFYTFGSHMLFQIFQSQENYNYGLKNYQNLVLLPRDYGFDLHKTNYNKSSLTSERRYEVLDKLYEFRRQ